MAASSVVNQNCLQHDHANAALLSLYVFSIFPLPAFQVDMMVINYVRQAETLKEIKKFIGNKVKRPFLISGICTQQALDNIDEIAKVKRILLLRYVSYYFLQTYIRFTPVTKIDYIHIYKHWRPIWRSGGNTRLLRKRSRVRFPHNSNISVYEHVCLYWVWVFLCIICMYLQKRYLSIYLSVI
jgi:hypothetical protein